MPTLVRWYVRTALLSLLLASLAGALVLAGRPLGAPLVAALAQPVFYHLLMVGWATQLIAGVALWMFPPLSRERPRGDERLGWLAYGALNGGLLLRVAAEPAQAVGGQPWAGPALIASALLQVVAVYLLVALLWPRVKGKQVAR
jgi:hypothetical protein